MFLTMGEGHAPGVFQPHFQSPPPQGRIPETLEALKSGVRHLCLEKRLNCGQHGICTVDLMGHVACRCHDEEKYVYGGVTCSRQGEVLPVRSEYIIGLSVGVIGALLLALIGFLADAHFRCRKKSGDTVDSHVENTYPTPGHTAINNPLQHARSSYPIQEARTISTLENLQIPEPQTMQNEGEEAASNRAKEIVSDLLAAQSEKLFPQDYMSDSSNSDDSSEPECGYSWTKHTDTKYRSTSSRVSIPRVPSRQTLDSSAPSLSTLASEYTINQLHDSYYNRRGSVTNAIKSSVYNPVNRTYRVLIIGCFGAEPVFLYEPWRTDPKHGSRKKSGDCVSKENYAAPYVNCRESTIHPGRNDTMVHDKLKTSSTIYDTPFKHLNKIGVVIPEDQNDLLTDEKSSTGSVGNNSDVTVKANSTITNESVSADPSSDSDIDSDTTLVYSDGIDDVFLKPRSTVKTHLKEEITNLTETLLWSIMGSERYSDSITSGVRFSTRENASLPDNNSLVSVNNANCSIVDRREMKACTFSSRPSFPDKLQQENRNMSSTPNEIETIIRTKDADGLHAKNNAEISQPSLSSCENRCSGYSGIDSTDTFSNMMVDINPKKKDKDFLKIRSINSVKRTALKSYNKIESSPHKRYYAGENHRMPINYVKGDQRILNSNAKENKKILTNNIEKDKKIMRNSSEENPKMFKNTAVENQNTLSNNGKESRKIIKSNGEQHQQINSDEKNQEILINNDKKNQKIITSDSEGNQKIVTSDSEGNHQIVTCNPERNQKIVISDSDGNPKIATSDSEGNQKIISSDSDENQKIVASDSEENQKIVMSDPEGNRKIVTSDSEGNRKIVTSDSEGNQKTVLSKSERNRKTKTEEDFFTTKL